VELEGGPVWQSYNDAEIPNDGTATRFSVEEVTGSGSWPAGRLYLTWRPATRHALRVLAAPLTIRETGTAPADIVFQGATFQGGVPLEATYTFDSWRLTYRYRFHEGDATRAWVGFTAKLRDAVVALEQGATEREKTDLGFVPLLHLAGSWRFAPRWTASLDADALAGGPGRAVDAALEVGYDVTPDWTVQLGYRTVEGGADVEEVYSFAWLHYGAVSLVWRP
jgi:hypothetical protein